MADEFVDPRTSKRVRANAQPGVAFITPGEEVKPPATTAPKTRTNQAKAGEAKAETGAPLKHPNSDKLVECFHCSGNHYISDCPDITAAQKAELLAARTAAYNKRRKEKAAREASGGVDTKAVGFV